MAFLQAEDYDNLPEEDDEAFARLEAISRCRLGESQTDQNGNLTYVSILSYMNEVAALASQFGIPGITYDEDVDENYYQEWGRFTRAVEYRLAQIHVQRSRRRRRNSVAITGPNRERIQHHLERLRDEIKNADITEKRKRGLLDKISEFEAELAKPRFDLVKAMALFALVAAATHDFVGTLIEAPNLVQAISTVLGTQKLAEEEAAKLLPPREPFKEIPDMREPKQKPQMSAFDSDLDDDVPF